MTRCKYCGGGNSVWHGHPSAYDDVLACARDIKAACYRVTVRRKVKA